MSEETRKTDADIAQEADIGTEENGTVKDEAAAAESRAADMEQEAGSEETHSPAEETEADAADGSEADPEDAPADDPKGRPDRKDKQIEELNDRYRRLFAEFDNFRKRTETEKTGMFAEGEKTVLLKVLPLIDNFERALASVPEDEKGTPFAEGIDKIYRSFTDQLKELGVAPIEAVGTPFDANLHNAVMHVEDEAAGESEVVEEFQKGYMFHDKVLRYSMVKVAN